MLVSTSKRTSVSTAIEDTENLELDAKLTRTFVQRLRLFLFPVSILVTALIASLPALANNRKDSLSSCAIEPQTIGAASSSVTPGSTDAQSHGVVLKRPRSRALSARETKRILDTTEHSLNQELSRITLSDAFDFADGRVLLRFDNGKGRLYESKVEFRAMLDDLERQASLGPRSVCRDFPQGEGFVEQVPQLVVQLSGLLKLDATDLDGSESSLDKVDKALRRLRPQQLLTPEIFAPLTAYVGEVLRNKTKGQWEMRRGTDADRTWEPWIVDPSGRAYAPFGIYKELLEYGRSASLRAFVAFPTVQEGPPSTNPVSFQVLVLSDPEDGKVVTGVPFSATTISEAMQTLANGDRAWWKMEGKLFRDSQGRFRREETMVTSLGLSTSSVVISDPIAGTSFELHADEKTAEQLTNPFARTNSTLKNAPQDAKTNPEQVGLPSGNLKTEDLGTQTLAGIAVQGRRITMTPPAGPTGNQNPPAIVLETWYSNNLHILMMSNRNDPWSGETTYRVTNIQLTEPDPSLFAVPEGYTVHSTSHGVSHLR